MQNNTVERRYEAGHVDRAYKLALLGLTNKDLATAFGVTEKTIYAWIDKYEEFKAALESARVIADAKVAASLYQRAIGYDKKVVKLAQSEGQFTDEKIIEEHVPADVGAAQFWLKNRQKELWTDRSEMEMTGSTGIVVNFDIPRPKLSELKIKKEGEG